MGNLLRRLNFFGVFVLCAVVFFVLAYGSVTLARVSDDVAIFWPANAVLVSLGFLFGRNKFPAIVLAAFIANVLIQVSFGDSITLGLAFATANSVEIAVVGTILMVSGIAYEKSLSPKIAMQVVAIIATAAVPAAAIGSGALYFMYGVDFYDVFVHWWAGDIVSSMIVLMPVFAFLSETNVGRKNVKLIRTQPVEAILICGATAAGLFILNALHLDAVVVLILPSLWLALKGRLFEVTLANSALLLLVAAALVTGNWPAGNESESLRDSLFQLQTLGVISTFPSVLVAISIQRLAKNQALVRMKNIQLELTLANMNQGISCFDNDFNLTVFNDQYAEIFAMQPTDLSNGMPFLEILNVQKASGNFEGDPRDLLKEILGFASKGEEFRAETTLASGKIVYTIHSPAPGGGWIATHEDVTEKRQIEMKLEYNSLHDVLTGLPNRRYFDNEFEARVEVAENSGTELAVLSIDLDNFKPINDSMGHDAGDAVLVWATSQIMSVLDDASFIARVGGDEFIILMNQNTGRTNLAKLATRINESLAEPFIYDGTECQFGASMGIAVAGGARIDKQRLLSDSDTALYSAKDDGRGRFMFFDPRMRKDAVEDRVKTFELRKAIEFKEFTATYLPRFDVISGELLGLDAMAFWRHPQYGLLKPSAYSQLSNRAKLCSKIDRIILEEISSSLKVWDAAGIKFPRVSIALSAQFLENENFPAILNKMGIDPKQISIVLSEVGILDVPSLLLKQAIANVRALGAKIEVGDFGMGAMSISTLTDLSPDTVKVAGRLTAPIGEEKREFSAPKSTLHVCALLDIDVVFQDIENSTQVRSIRKWGGTIMQGAYFSQPLDAQQFVESYAELSSKSA